MKYIDVYVGDLRPDDVLDWIFFAAFVYIAYLIGSWVGVALLLLFFALRIRGK